MDAVYHPSTFPEEQGNPLIEALPPLRTDQEWLDILEELPECTDEDRCRPPREREFAADRLDTFFLPMWRNLEIAFALEDSLRKSYWWRNPMSLPGRVEPDHRLRLLNQEQHTGFAPPTASAAGFNIIGDPGVGKTSTVNRVLSSIPQVIRHSRYQGSPLMLKQLTWIRLDLSAAMLKSPISAR